MSTKGLALGLRFCRIACLSFLLTVACFENGLARQLVFGFPGRALMEEQLLPNVDDGVIVNKSCVQRSLSAVFSSCDTVGRDGRAEDSSGLRVALSAMLHACVSVNGTDVQIRRLRVLAGLARLYPELRRIGNTFSAATGIPLYFNLSTRLGTSGPIMRAAIARPPPISDTPDASGGADAFIASPSFMVSMAKAGKLLDLGPLVSTDLQLKWFQINQVLRDQMVVYSNKIVAIPVTTSPVFLYYHAPIFARDNLAVPVTWDQVIDLAKQYHGKDLNGDGKPDFGICMTASSCFVDGTWLQWILASFVQTHGSSQGIYLDPHTLRNLANSSGMAQSLEVFRQLRRYGPLTGNCTVFEDQEFLRGRCLMSLTSPTTLKAAYASDAPPDYGTMRGRMGVASFPGSIKVLDRTTGQLVLCNATLCPLATNMAADESGVLRPVNQPAPSTNVIVMINAQSEPKYQYYAYSLFSYLTSPEVLGTSGASLLLDPRLESSPLRDTDLRPSSEAVWVARGYHPSDVAAFFAAYRASMDNANQAFECKFPGSINLTTAATTAAMVYTPAIPGYTPPPIAAVLANITRMLEGVIAEEGGMAAFAPIYRQTLNWVGPEVGSGEESGSGGGDGNGGGVAWKTVVAVAVPCGVALLAGLAAAAFVLHRRRRLAAARLGAQMVAAPGAGPDTTLLVTDIQSSTSLWEHLDPVIMDRSLSLHHTVMRRAFAEWRGYESTTEGDSFIVAFHNPTDALLCALAAQQYLLEAPWPSGLLSYSPIPQLEGDLDPIMPVVVVPVVPRQPPSNLRSPKLQPTSSSHSLLTRGAISLMSYKRPSYKGLASSQKWFASISASVQPSPAVSSCRPRSGGATYVPGGSSARALMEMLPETASQSVSHFSRTSSDTGGGDGGGGGACFPLQLGSPMMYGGGSGGDGAGPSNERVSGGNGPGGRRRTLSPLPLGSIGRPPVVPEQAPQPAVLEPLPLLTQALTEEGQEGCQGGREVEEEEAKDGLLGGRGSGGGAREGVNFIGNPGPGWSCSSPRSQQQETGAGAAGLTDPSQQGSSPTPGLLALKYAKEPTHEPITKQPSDSTFGAADDAPGQPGREPRLTMRSGSTGTEVPWQQTTLTLAASIQCAVRVICLPGGGGGGGPLTSRAISGGLTERLEHQESFSTTGSGAGAMPLPAGAVPLFAGLRVRMGMWTGVPYDADVGTNATNRRTQYSGTAIVMAKAVSDTVPGGMVVISECSRRRLDPAIVRSARHVILYGGLHVLSEKADDIVSSQGPLHLYNCYSQALLPRAIVARPVKSSKELRQGALAAPVGHGTVIQMRVVGVDVLLAWNRDLAVASLELLHAAALRLLPPSTVATNGTSGGGAYIAYGGVLEQTLPVAFAHGGNGNDNGTGTATAVAAVTSAGSNHHNHHSNPTLGTTAGGSTTSDTAAPGGLVIVFPEADDAVCWAAGVRRALNTLEWPHELLEHELGEEVWATAPANAGFGSYYHPPAAGGSSTPQPLFRSAAQDIALRSPSGQQLPPVPRRSRFSSQQIGPAVLPARTSQGVTLSGRGTQDAVQDPNPHGVTDPQVSTALSSVAAAISADRGSGAAGSVDVGAAHSGSLSLEARTSCTTRDGGASVRASPCYAASPSWAADGSSAAADSAVARTLLDPAVPTIPFRSEDPGGGTDNGLSLDAARPAATAATAAAGSGSGARARPRASQLSPLTRTGSSLKVVQEGCVSAALDVSLPPSRAATYASPDPNPSSRPRPSPSGSSLGPPALLQAMSSSQPRTPGSDLPLRMAGAELGYVAPPTSMALLAAAGGEATKPVSPDARTGGDGGGGGPRRSSGSRREGETIESELLEGQELPAIPRVAPFPRLAATTMLPSSSSQTSLQGDIAGGSGGGGGGGAGDLCLRLLYRGLRLRWGVAAGPLKGELVAGDVSGQVSYRGKAFTKAAKLVTKARAGQICATADFARALPAFLAEELTIIEKS